MAAKKTCGTCKGRGGWLMDAVGRKVVNPDKASNWRNCPVANCQYGQVPA